MKSVPGIAFDQLGFVVSQIVLHRLDAAGLGSSRLSQLPHHPVIDQPFAQFHDLNVRILGLPHLSIGQGGQGLLPIRFYFHAY
jgi:hypothetical protein